MQNCDNITERTSPMRTQFCTELQAIEASSGCASHLDGIQAFASKIDLSENNWPNTLKFILWDLDRVLMFIDEVGEWFQCKNGSGATPLNAQRGDGQMWGHTPEQRVAASTLRRYYFVLGPVIAQAYA